MSAAPIGWRWLADCTFVAARVPLPRQHGIGVLSSERPMAAALFTALSGTAAASQNLKCLTDPYKALGPQTLVCTMRFSQQAMTSTSWILTNPSR